MRLFVMEAVRQAEGKGRKFTESNRTLVRG